ncbi:hypothetical protein SanaruYs_11710 [Chryseotalea sanaruensis]|uniref:Uncharacterized protein n=1 Tax=Chryseotalea sanaruensis TaxID=2482724 RepID=A0A401U7T9_9BACT|nr:hypothetical protein [Chryseotalea sanaruensis]GCC50952.1 hypothetical protein SanaruYs_11710 [Chryseotalea sanaruensis]
MYEKETVYKEDILDYFDALMVSTKGEFNDEISEFKNSINFRKVETYDLRTTEKIISAEITSLNSFQDAERVKAIFFLNNGKIVRSNIVTFDHEMRFDKHDDIIVSILNMDASTQIYTGRMTVYNAFQKLLMYNIYESGKLVENAMARIDAGANPTSGKTNGCTNWYLITTTYYSDGSTTTTTEYLYTSCSGGNCEEQASRGSKINCGGGPWTGGAGSPANSNPSFPSLPANGDVYEFTNANGEYTKYQFDSQKGIWVVIERILPPITIILEPENYPFLMIQWPVHNQKVFGADLFTYTYDGGSGNWNGEPTNVVISPDRPISNMTDYLKCFTSTQSATVTIYVDQPVEGSNDAYAITWGGAVVGHTFVSITQGSNRSVFGFYPSTDETSPTSPPEPSVMGDDSGEGFDASISITISGPILQQILQYVINYNATYDLDNYNCSDFGISVGNLAGLALPDSYGSWPGGGGSNPGALGQHIRSRSSSGNISVNKVGGNAPTNNRNCN